MATGTMKWYGLAFTSLLNKEIDFQSGAAIRWLHTNATEVPDQDLDNYVDDVRANEVTGTNLAADGNLLANCTVTYTAATNVCKLDADDISVASVTVSTGIKNGHIADFTAGSDATRPLIGYVVWDTAMSPSAGTLQVTFDANGILTITPS